jgi:hypothetical protein
MYLYRLQIKWGYKNRNYVLHILTLVVMKRFIAGMRHQELSYLPHVYCSYEDEPHFSL